MSVTAAAYVPAMRGYSPWAEAATIPHLSIRHRELPEDTGGALVARRGERVWIILDVDLTSAQRRCALAHELEHLRRGDSLRIHDHIDEVTIIREENAVDRAVVGRLVPRAELRRFIDRQIELGIGVSPVEVAEEFNVTLKLAAMALRDLRETAA